MKSLLKKILRFSLYFAFAIALIFATNIKSEAGWGGVSSLDSYQQEESDMRAVWVATVSNLNIPAQSGKGEAAINQWKKYYLEIRFFFNILKNFL